MERPVGCRQNVKNPWFQWLQQPIWIWFRKSDQLLRTSLNSWYDRQLGITDKFIYIAKWSRSRDNSCGYEQISWHFIENGNCRITSIVDTLCVGWKHHLDSICNAMSRDPFFKLMRCLHFTNDHGIVTNRSDDNYNRFAKLQLVQRVGSII